MTSGGKIYLVADENKLIEMNESQYKSEEVLQKLLISYSDLLAGDQIRPEEPLRWLLIKREIGIPCGESGGDRWSLDHLFVDNDGIPTFVECKRSSDSRIRREVVGQMLDYAANAIEYWPMEKLRQSAAETAQKEGKDLNELVLSLLNLTSADEEEAVEFFWESVEQNLRDGRIRLLFVSDYIPSELRRVIEFLNFQMSRMEVIAVEVKQYTGGGATALVPRVLGLSEAAKSRKEKAPPRRTTPWSEEEFLDDLHSRQLPEIRVKAVEGLLDFAKRLESEGRIDISWGKGRETGSFTIKQGGTSYISVWSNGNLQLSMGAWKHPIDLRHKIAQDLGNKLGIELDYKERAYPNFTDIVHSTDNGVENLIKWLKFAIELTESANN